jgi:hypothetical protein
VLPHGNRAEEGCSGFITVRQGRFCGRYPLSGKFPWKISRLHRTCGMA